jgi:aconitase A
MGIIPLQYKAGDTAESLGLTGTEQFSVNLPEELKPRQNIMVRTQRVNLLIKGLKNLVDGKNFITV